MEKTLILVRHGATQANLSRPYTLQGLRPDGALAREGVVQAQAAARALRRRPVQRVYCSPLRRARQTAELIAAGREVPVEVEGALAEADVGLWSGLTWAEVERRWPEPCRAFRDDPETHGYLGGENLAQVRDRVLPAIARLLAVSPERTLVVVGHGVVHRVLLAHWLGLPLSCARRLPQDNGGISVVTYRAGVAGVRTVNAVAHLGRSAAGEGRRKSFLGRGS
jgi:broad specificity phosphatase PhoE